MNSEPPVSNRTLHQHEIYTKQRMHLQRLQEIAIAGKRRVDLGNTWKRTRLNGAPAVAARCPGHRCRHDG